MDKFSARCRVELYPVCKRGKVSKTYKIIGQNVVDLLFCGRYLRDQSWGAWRNTRYGYLVITWYGYHYRIVYRVDYEYSYTRTHINSNRYWVQYRVLL